MTWAYTIKSNTIQNAAENISYPYCYCISVTKAVSVSIQLTLGIPLRPYVGISYEYDSEDGEANVTLILRTILHRKLRTYNFQ